MRGSVLIDQLGVMETLLWNRLLGKTSWHHVLFDQAENRPTFAFKWKSATYLGFPLQYKGSILFHSYFTPF